MYERKLHGEWGFRKNLSAHEWEYILRKRHKRSDLGKNTRVTHDGLIISSNRIKNRERTYSLSDINRIVHSGGRPDFFLENPFFSSLL